MRTLALIVFCLICIIKPAHSFELIGYTQDKINGKQAIIEPSKYTKKQNLYSAGELITNKTRLIDVKNACIKSNKVDIISEKCLPLNKVLNDEYFSIIGKNINSKIILIKLSYVLDVPVIYDKSISNYYFKSIEIYNVNNNGLFTRIKKLFKSKGLNIINKNGIIIVSNNIHLEEIFKKPNVPIELAALKIDKKLTLLLNNTKAQGFFLMFSHMIGSDISYTLNEQNSISVIMRNPLNPRSMLSVFLLSTRLMGYKLIKNSNNYYVVTKI